MTLPPLLSGREIVKAFKKLGYHKVSQKGSHIKIYNAKLGITLIVPYHKEVDRWLLSGVLKEAGITVEQFKNAL